ncbi:hypothetical protein BH20GEM1_BH20GEM1_11230 [soil metagenome]
MIHVSESALTLGPIPGSTKIHVQGSRPDLRVPMRLIAQSDTRVAGESRPNPELAVYDTSGPYTDPGAAIDPRRGLPPVRDAWIEERGDSEPIAGAGGNARVPRRARPGRTVTQMHYARRGIVTP